MSNIAGIFSIRQDSGRHAYWNATTASWANDPDDRTEFVLFKDGAVSEVTTAAVMEALGHGGIIEDRSWLLMGHRLFLGYGRMYQRSTCKGNGGSLTVEKATHYTKEGARMNLIPALKGGRGFEMVHVRDAEDIKGEE